MTPSWKAVKRFARSDRIDALVDLGTPESPLPARLLRVVLPNGSVSILATHGLDPAFSPSAFADLYHGRWRTEEAENSSNSVTTHLPQKPGVIFTMNK